MGTLKTLILKELYRTYNPYSYTAENLHFFSCEYSSVFQPFFEQIHDLGFFGRFNKSTVRMGMGLSTEDRTCINHHCPLIIRLSFRPYSERLGPLSSHDCSSHNLDIKGDTFQEFFFVSQIIELACQAAGG